MRLRVTHAWLEKPGLAPDEYEDAFCPGIRGEYRGRSLRCAVGDGATEGVMSGPWARILAESYCRSRAGTQDLARVLGRAYRRWAAHKILYLQAREAGGGVPWYVEEGLRTGAFSTLLGLTLTGPSEGANGEWHALAVGDSCLFQVRGDALLTSFPAEDAAAFGNRPLLIGSNPAYNTKVPGEARRARGQWRTGDCMLLATDALAAWFLFEHAEGRAPWQSLHELCTGTGGAFREWVRGLQALGRLRRDDVTLLRIEIV